MEDIKNLLRATASTIPSQDFGEGDLVRPSAIKEDIKELSEKTKLIERLENYTSADDVFQDFSPEAAKRIVYEMHHGKTAQDRLKASEHILNRAHGKPVDRVMNINMEVSQKSEKELESDILKLLGQTNLGEVTSGRLILDEQSGEGELVEEPSLPESAEGSQSA